MEKKVRLHVGAPLYATWRQSRATLLYLELCQIVTYSPQILKVLRCVEIMADFVESVLKMFAILLGKDTEIYIKFVLSGEFEFYFIVFIGIVCECPGCKCCPPVLQHVLLQVFAEGRTRYVPQYAYAYEIAMHQQAESRQIVFPAHNLAGIFLAKEMDNRLHDAVCHSSIVNGREEEARIMRWRVNLITCELAVFDIQTLGVAFYLIRHGYYCSV